MKKERNLNSNKKKGLRTSLAIHAGILLLALMPFMKAAITNDEVGFEMVEIQFVNADISSGAGSTAPKEVKPVEEPVEKKDFTEKKVEAPVKESKEIITDEVETEVVVEENMSEEAEDFEMENAPVEEVVEEVVVEEVVEEVIEEVDGSKSESEAGEGDKGEAITGKDLGSMDFDGEGIFGRKVIHRADVKKITEREGVVVINLCVNRLGKVTHVAFNKDNSTIADPEYIRRAMDVASDYLFEKDYTAPETQCGKLSFIFHIE